MSTIAGYFDETIQQAIRIRQSQLAFGDRTDLQFMPQIESLKSVMANETQKITQLENSNKDVTVEVEWINACQIGTTSCTNCTFGGTELSTNVETYTLNLCQESKFRVFENPMRTNDFSVEELVALGFVKADVELAEWANGQVLAAINNAKGTNLLAPGTNRGCISGNDTYITAPYWGAELLAYTARMNIWNRFSNSYMLTGANLHESKLIADFNSGNADGKGKVSMFGSMPIFFDEVNIETLFPNQSFIMNKGAMAIANKVRYPNRIRYFDQERWSIGSDFTSLKYDVHYTNTCQTDNDTFLHEYKVILRMAIPINPTGCDDNNTGILSLICGECPD